MHSFTEIKDIADLIVFREEYDEIAFSSCAKHCIIKE